MGPTADIPTTIGTSTPAREAYELLREKHDGQRQKVNGRPYVEHPISVANDVRDLHVAVLNGGDLTLLYERGKHLVSAAFDPLSLTKKREQEIDVPQLK